MLGNWWMATCMLENWLVLKQLPSLNFITTVSITEMWSFILFYHNGALVLIIYLLPRFTFQAVWTVCCNLSAVLVHVLSGSLLLSWLVLKQPPSFVTYDSLNHRNVITYFITMVHWYWSLILSISLIYFPSCMDCVVTHQCWYMLCFQGHCCWPQTDDYNNTVMIIIIIHCICIWNLSVSSLFIRGFAFSY